jgi:hypothetical protein
MAVMARESWSDERLTYFEKSVDERFDRVDERFDRVDEKFVQIEKRLDRVDGDIRELRQAITSMHQSMSVGFIGLAGLIVSQALFF